jgi:hypothetical protein
VAQATGHKEKRPRGLLPAREFNQQTGGSKNGKRKTEQMTYFRLLLTNARLARINAHLMAKLIIQQIELETIAEDPTSDKAKEIIARYRLKIEQRKEIEQAGQN